jgi:hypothetical protein
MANQTVLMMDEPDADRPDPIEEAVVNLLNLAVVLQGSTIQCRMCGECNQKHSSECPVPVLERYINLF